MPGPPCPAVHSPAPVLRLRDGVRPAGRSLRECSASRARSPTAAREPRPPAAPGGHRSAVVDPRRDRSCIRRTRGGLQAADVWQRRDGLLVPRSAHPADRARYPRSQTLHRGTGADEYEPMRRWSPAPARRRGLLEGAARRVTTCAMVRRDDDGSPTGESPVSVSGDAPSRRPPAPEETLASEAERRRPGNRREPLTGWRARGPQLEVKWVLAEPTTGWGKVRFYQ